MKWAVIGSGNVWETKAREAFEGHATWVIPNRDWVHHAEEAIAGADAVYICTPPSSHLEYARLAAKHKKPCLVEKPMALNVVEAGIMASLFQEAKTPLWVAYYRRCLPRFLTIKELMGKLGKLRFCHIQHTLRPQDHPVAPVVKGQPIPWRYIPAIAGRGGNFTDMATHHLDLVDYLLGRIDGVNGRAENKGGLYEADDTVSAQMTTAHGVHVTGQWCYVANHNEDWMQIVGDNGYIKFSVFKDWPIEGKIGDDSYFVREAKNPPWVHKPLVESIVNELNGGDKCPTNWENGLRAMMVQEKILSGHAGGV